VLLHRDYDCSPIECVAKLLFFIGVVVTGLFIGFSAAAEVAALTP
jgi:hypothetical protein